MDKRGFELMTVIKYIIAAIVILLLLKISIGVVNVFLKNPDRQSLQSLETMNNEILLLVEDVSDSGNIASIIVPVQIAKQFTVSGGGTDNSRLCMFHEDNPSQPKKCLINGATIILGGIKGKDALMNVDMAAINKAGKV